MIKVYVAKGLGIGCHEEVAHAYEKAGANVEIVHLKQILNGDKKLSDAQVLNLSGGFLHGDILGAGMCAANELEHSTVRDGSERKIKDLLLEFKEKGNVVYGQCNGYQLMVKTRLLPGIDGDFSKQTLTLTHNACGNYRVGFVLHKVEDTKHFAFKGIDNIRLWCRNGEGNLQFRSQYGSVTKQEAAANRRKVNENHVLLRYIDPNAESPTQEFRYNANGSIDGIAGLSNGTFFGHMAHPEVGIYASRDPQWFSQKDRMRRQGIKAKDLDEKLLEGEALKVFRNIVNHFK